MLIATVICIINPVENKLDQFWFKIKDFVQLFNVFMLGGI